MKNNYRFLKFAGSVLLVFAVLCLVPQLPDPLVLFMQNVTGALVVFVSHLMGLTAHYDPVTQLFNVAGFDMLLGPECIAIHYWAILTLTVILFPGQPWRRRLIGWLATSTGLVSFNVLRLIFLGLVGAYFPDFFEAVHDYVWQVAFALLTVFLCLAWVERPQERTLSPLKIVLSGFVFSAMFSMLLEVYKHAYLTGLVWGVDKFMLLLNNNMDWTLRKWTIMNNNFVMVRLEKNYVKYLLPGDSYTLNIWLDVLAMALFWGGCAGVFIWTWRRNAGFISLAHFCSRTCLGTLVLLSAQVLSMIILGRLLMLDDGINLGRNYLWWLRSQSVILPLLLWWWVWKRSMPLEAVHQD